jgi:hypothetical protein
MGDSKAPLSPQESVTAEAADTRFQVAPGTPMGAETDVGK